MTGQTGYGPLLGERERRDSWAAHRLIADLAGEGEAVAVVLDSLRPYPFVCRRSLRRGQPRKAAALSGDVRR